MVVLGVIVVELLLYNMLLGVIGLWSLVLSSIGLLSVPISCLLVWLKKVLGFYEDKPIRPQYTVVISVGITLFIMIMYFALLKWRATM